MSSNAKVNFCTDCRFHKHYAAPICFGDSGWDEHICNNPTVVRVDYITKQVYPESCNEVRGEADLCPLWKRKTSIWGWLKDNW